MTQPYVKAAVLSGSLAPWQLPIFPATASLIGHAHFVTSTGEILDAHPLHKGVSLRPADKPSVIPTWELRYQLEGRFPERDLRDIYSRLTTQLGKPYDWLWIAGYPFNRDWQKDDSWVCFEYMAWGLLPWLRHRKKLSRITGRHLKELLDAAAKAEFSFSMGWQNGVQVYNS